MTEKLTEEELRKLKNFLYFIAGFFELHGERLTGQDNVIARELIATFEENS